MNATLTAREWVRLISDTHVPSKERVVVAGKSRNILKVKKSQWQRHFKGFGGIAFKKGKELEVIAAKSGGPRAELPAWVAQQLRIEEDDGLCVTERNGKFYVKRLHLTEMDSEAPGCMILDTFTPTAVRRDYALA